MQQALHCSHAELGQLSPWIACQHAPFAGARLKAAHDPLDEAVHGMHLPHSVQLELRMLGYPLLAYTRGELEDAVIASSVDRTMIENPHGLTFRDKLKKPRQISAPRPTSPQEKLENREHCRHPHPADEEDCELWLH